MIIARENCIKTNGEVIIKKGGELGDYEYRMGLIQNQGNPRSSWPAHVRTYILHRGTVKRFGAANQAYRVDG